MFLRKSLFGIQELSWRVEWPRSLRKRSRKPPRMTPYRKDRIERMGDIVSGWAPEG